MAKFFNVTLFSQLNDVVGAAADGTADDDGNADDAHADDGTADDSTADDGTLLVLLVLLLLSLLIERNDDVATDYGIIFLLLHKPSFQQNIPYTIPAANQCENK